MDDATNQDEHERTPTNRRERRERLNLSHLTPEEIARQVLTTPPPSATLSGKADSDSSPHPQEGD